MKTSNAKKKDFDATNKIENITCHQTNVFVHSFSIEGISKREFALISEQDIAKRRVMPRHIHRRQR